MTASVFATEPASETASPLDRLKERSAVQRFQETRDKLFPGHAKAEHVPVADTKVDAAATKVLSESGTPATEGPAPLDLPMSGFGLGRTDFAETRPDRPMMFKSVPQPDFEDSNKKSIAESKTITLPDYLSPQAGLQPVVVAQGNLLPPAPVAEINDLSEAKRDGMVPGMVDTVFRPISQIQPYYAYSPTGKRPLEYMCPQPSSVPDNERARCPEIQPLKPAGSTHRDFAMMDFHWNAADLKHKPLYFEDVALERYGQQYPYGIQPFVSLGKFGVQGIGLPYQMALDPVCRDIYALGYYRPGDCAPELIYQVPFNLQAAAVAGGAYTGLIFLFP